MFSSSFGTVLKYGATFLGGLIAGGFLMKNAINKAMMKNYEQMMGQMDPQMLAAMGQQMPGNVGGQPLNGLNVVSQAPEMQVPQQTQFSVNRTGIKPMNITASQLGGGGLKV